MKRRRSAASFEYTRLWRLRNREHVLTYAKNYAANRTPEQKEKARLWDRERSRKRREADRDAYNARLRKWYKDYPDKVKERNKRWTAKNKGKVLAIKHKRRAKDSRFTQDDLIDIRKLQKGKCAYCRDTLTTANEQIDHIIAIANGGTNHRRNIQLLCAPCNRRKSKRDPIYHAQRMGLLL